MPVVWYATTCLTVTLLARICPCSVPGMSEDGMVMEKVVDVEGWRLMLLVRSD
jgi:hypothetical protein